MSEEQSPFHASSTGQPPAWEPSPEVREVMERYRDKMVADLEAAMKETKEAGGNESDQFSVGAEIFAHLLARMVDRQQQRAKFIQFVRRDPLPHNGLPVETCIGIFLNDTMWRFWRDQYAMQERGGAKPS